MSGRWFYVPPNIEGWHEEGFDVHDKDFGLGENPVVCRDCRSEADARLIASAPDLLEKARRVVDLHAQKYAHEYLGVYEDAMHDLSEVVQKAEGNQS